MTSTVPKSLLKDLPLKLQNSSRKPRLELLYSISEAFKNVSSESDKSGEDTVPSELAAKSMAKILPMVLPRYLDNPSRRAMCQLIQTLMEIHPETVFKVLSMSLFETFSSWASIYPSLYLVKISIAGLQWSLILTSTAMSKG